MATTVISIPQQAPLVASGNSIKYADSLLCSETQLPRMEAALTPLARVGVPPSSRLTYRLQPAISLSSLHDPTHNNEENNRINFGLACLSRDAEYTTRGMEMNDGSHSLEQLFGGYKVLCPQFLSYLDAYNCLPLAAHTPAVTSRAQKIRALIIHFELEKYEIMARCRTSDYPGTIQKCTVLLLYTRLLFYRARFEGQSLATSEPVVDQARALLGLPRNLLS
ncbi:hypothetical protein EJ02DRAFT_482167 [Clathrospora elynae]|uniref:Uncharacterized protein n=1 Tax=Clathrospora elynae TaxID=706981 RepID=A0A6A5SFB5_9PLEO|nr:hypothetical protein EJ02DRAFT_482167 [Clathrospora elynae]